MSLLRILVRDRRLWLMGLLGVLAVVVSRFTVTAETAVNWVVKGGYWAVLAVFVLFAYSVSRILRDAFRQWRPSRPAIGGLCLVLLAGSVLLAHERYGFKILADEVILLGTSMGIHFKREIACPIRATDIQGPFQLLQNVLDKRPFFYPFLVSLGHDFTGYRPDNAFYLNSALGFVFLGLIFFAGRRLGGTPWAGALGVLLFAGLPLLAQQMKGGGFELLNLVMITAILLLGMRFTERRDEVSLDALCLATVLLAFTRYESVILLPSVAGLILWVWWREQRVILTWRVILCPVFLAFYLLQNRVFTVNESTWELAGRPGATTPFGLQYVADNLGHALGFFFDTSGYQPNSPFFAAVGLLAAPFFALWLVRVLRTSTRTPPADVAVACMGAGLFGIWLLLTLYFWGQFDHPLIRRLSLPVHLLMFVAVVVVGRVLLRHRRGWQALCGAALLGLIAYSLPVMSRRAYAASYSPAVEMEWRREFLQRFPERDYLFIDNDSTFWITSRVPATPALQARQRKEGLVYHLRNHSFSAMYVFQRYHVDPETGERKLDAADDVGPDFELESVWERRIQTLLIGRISRVLRIRENGEIAAEAGLVTPVPGSTLPPAELDTAKKEYVDHWLKQLP